MGVSTAAGAKLYIGTTALSPVGDTFTNVGEIINIPAFGRTYNEIKYAPLNSRGVQKFKGSYDDGSVAVEIGKDLSDAGQAALVVALDVDADYNFKIVDNDAVAAQSAAVTITVAAPGVVTDTAHGLLAGTAIQLSTTGTLPTGLSPATTYYIVSPTTNAYSLAATAGGSPITTTGSAGTGHTRTTVPAGTTMLFRAKVMSHLTNRGTVDSVITSTVSLGIKAGSITETVHIP